MLTQISTRSFFLIEKNFSSSPLRSGGPLILREHIFFEGILRLKQGISETLLLKGKFDADIYWI